MDRATGAQIALSRYPRVALRGDAPAPLEAAARRVRGGARLGAVVTSVDAMKALATPRTVLRALSDATAEVTDRAAWRLDGDATRIHDRTTVNITGITVLVPGEVVLRRYRLGRAATGRGREPTVTAASERRVRVLDLHGPTSFLRVVQGVTDLAGFSPSGAHASRRSLQLLADAPPWPGARAVASRTVQSVRVPAAAALRETGQAEADAWPLWEEHTRQVRLLAGLGPLSR